ncbi:MAG: helix-turn-helix domain-containing protein [Gammaproteobacteria bacterium]
MSPAPADRPAAGGSLGEELRAAREARHLELHKAAQDMHVGDEILQQLEQDNYAALGAPIFVHGHLRNYARLLGLPPDEVLAKYDQASGRLAPPPLVTQRTGNMNRMWRSVGLPASSIMVIVVLVVLAVVWWQHQAPNSPAPVVAQTAMPGSVPSTPGAGSAGAVTPAQRPTAVGEEARSAASREGERRRAAEPIANTTGAARVQPAPLKSTVNEHAVGSVSLTEQGVASAILVHVQFSVHQASWIEVYDAAGKRLYYSLAPAGDKIEIHGLGPLQVFLGNSPGVSIEYNGAMFNQAPFTQSNTNTARFTLGGGAGGGKPGA